MQTPELILHYFPELTEQQQAQFAALGPLYEEWNSKINVISRKDMDQFYEKHVLHSLGIAKVHTFLPGQRILDVGTGGGFPGIPLAILFPETQFHLVDSIGKKIKVVEAVAQALGLTNVQATHQRAERIAGTYDFAVSRAVTHLHNFLPWIKGKIGKPHQDPTRQNGLLYLKGGDLAEEIGHVKASIYPLHTYFKGEFFETKKVVYVPKSEISAFQP